MRIVFDTKDFEIHGSSDVVAHGKYYPECIDCTKNMGFDIVFTMSCFFNNHTRLWIADKEEEE